MSVPFIAVTEAAFTQLVNEQYAVLRRALAAHERLERVVLSERGLDALAGTLATLIGAAVLVFDARGEPLAFNAPFAGRWSLTRLRRCERRAPVSAAAAERIRRGRSCHLKHRPRRSFALALPVAADGGTGAAARQRGRWAHSPGARSVAGGDQGLAARCRILTGSRCTRP